MVVWHCTNLVDGGGTLRLNLLVVRYTLLKVPEIGTSSHLRIYWLTIESRFSKIQVLGSGATVKCQESFDKTKRV